MMSNIEGMAKAKAMGLDLVEIAPLAKPPVCKIMNFGKYKYELKKRERKIRYQERGKGLKEIKFSPKINPHDYETKMRHIREFVVDRGKAKVTIMFRGREVVHKDLGHKLLEKLIKDLGDVAYIEQPAKDEGPNITMLFGVKPGMQSKPASHKKEEEKDAKTQDA